MNKFIQNMNHLFYFLIFFRNEHFSNTLCLFQKIMKEELVTDTKKSMLIELAVTEIEYLETFTKFHLRINPYFMSNNIKIIRKKMIHIIYDFQIPNYKLLYDFNDYDVVNEKNNKMLLYQIVYSENLCRELIKLLNDIDLSINQVLLSHQLEFQLKYDSMFNTVYAKTAKELSTLQFGQETQELRRAAL